ncbi:MAG: hypothetical protein H0W43_05750 [Chthoniobacterales bacterium]|jgi:hypothetical protein|nr:hypothetical protein [Chthoniobacterales bacterium]
MRPALLLSILCLTIGGLLLLSGCASAARPKAVPTASAAARPRVVGEVAVVDEEKRFVLIDLQSNLYVPPPGTELRTTNSAGDTARLKASPEQKRPFIAADIVDGDPAVGDEVLK